MPKMSTRAKMQLVAIDRARRENLQRHILLYKRYSCTYMVYVSIYDRLEIAKRLAFMNGVSDGDLK